MDPRSTATLHTGRKMPLLGLGTWLLKEDTAGTVEHALRKGYQMIDTSGDYGTQHGIGEGIKRSGVARGDIYIITKVEEDEDAYESTRKNIAEMQLEYADLMLIHRPPPSGAGEELWRGLMRARDEGYAKDIGVSNYSTALIQALIDDSGEVPVVNQIEWSPFGHSNAMLDYCDKKKILIQAYSPLTRGQRLDDPTLKEIAAKHGKSPAQVLIRWNLQLGTSPIPKANQKQHLEENLDVFDFELTPEDITRLSGLNERFSALSGLPYV